MKIPKIKLKFSLSAKNKKVRILILLLCLATLVVLLKVFFVAALVNGVPISRMKIISELEKQGGRQVLDTLVQKALIFQEAKRQKIKISDEIVDSQIKDIEETLKSQNLTLDDALAARGQTRADLKTQIKIQKTVEALIGERIKVTEEDISGYFTANKDLYEGQKLEDVKSDIQAQLYQESLNTEYSKWIKELQDKAKIFFLVKYQ